MVESICIVISQHRHENNNNVDDNSLISGDIILSAAHCASAFTKGQEIYVGGIRNDGSDATYTVTVDKIRVHPDYQSINDLDHDFMLIKIEEDLSGVVVPEWNDDPSVPVDEATCVSFGFGATEFGSGSDVLLQVQLPIVNQAQCEVELAPTFGPGIITDDMICAGGEPGRDTCYGDSGSPLMCDGKIVGVVSFGNGCGNPLPAVRGLLDSLSCLFLFHSVSCSELTFHLFAFVVAAGVFACELRYRVHSTRRL
jgi:trypsin